MTIKEALRWAKQALVNASDTPEFDAKCLLAYCLACSVSYLRTWPEKSLDAGALALFKERIHRRQQGEPVAYILGAKGFWDFDLSVTADTLIPRPETELMVEYILSRFPPGSCIRFCDWGTGTGAIALAVASERPRWQVSASDYSESALAVAKSNAEQLALILTLTQSNWGDAFSSESFDIIASNPPYIAPGDPHLLRGDLRHEPVSALVAEKHGFADIEKILIDGKRCLKPGGLLILEHGFEQGEQVASLFTATDYCHIEQLKDYQGHTRFTLGNKKG